jgi:protein O-mannosyl-transferase
MPRGAQPEESPAATGPTQLPLPLWPFCAALLVLTIGAFFPALGHPFIRLDDPDYVTRNSHIQHGLTLASLKWAWTSHYASNWHPLTWLSHMLDWSLFGKAPQGHHLVNVLLHAANVVLLFLFLARATLRPWPSLLTAAVFAVHPLHVESVAWVAERKDVLSGLFFFLTLLAYLRYVRRPDLSRYLLVCLLFALGLSAKQMLVTVPALLLLLDVWPLLRLRPGGAGDAAAAAPAPFLGAPTTWPRLILEKLPLLALAIAASALTIVAQRGGNQLKSLDALPLPGRIATALVAYVTYLGQTVWPARLAIIYPLPAGGIAWTWPQLAASTTLLFALTALCLWQLRKRPQLLVGWLWFLGMLVPVIGLVQVGGQRAADRYMYLPQIGLVIAAAFSLPRLATRRSRTLAFGAGAAVVAALLVLCLHQLFFWRDSRTLYAHAIELSPENPNPLAASGLGAILIDEGKLDEAETLCKIALKANPESAFSMSNLGMIALKRHQQDEALKWFEAAENATPDDRIAPTVFERTLILFGRADQAAERLRGRMARHPGEPRLEHALGLALDASGHAQDALVHLGRAVALEPEDPSFRMALGNAFAKQGMFAEAGEQFAAAVELAPELESARESLKRARDNLARGQRANPQ